MSGKMKVFPLGGENISFKVKSGEMLSNGNYC